MSDKKPGKTTILLGVVVVLALAGLIPLYISGRATGEGTVGCGGEDFSDTDPAVGGTEQEVLETTLQSTLTQAIKDNKITKKEVQEGFHKIREAEGKLGESQTERMRMKWMLLLNAQARKLRPSAPTPPNAHELFMQIQGASGKQRRILTNQYLEVVDRLPPKDRMQALSKLNKLSAANKKTPFLPALSDYVSNIEKATKEEKTELIKQYIDAAERLEPKEYAQAMSKLNKIVGRHKKAPAKMDISLLAQKIELATGKQKQSLIKEYLASADALTPKEKMRAMLKLNKLVSSARNKTQAKPNISQLESQIAQSPEGEQKQALIKKYLEIADTLPTKERYQALGNLNKLAGRAK